jgi:hypothetical protein
MVAQILKEDGGYSEEKFMTTGLLYARQPRQTVVKQTRFLLTIGQIAQQLKTLMIGSENDTKILVNQIGIPLCFIAFADLKNW